MYWNMTALSVTLLANNNWLSEENTTNKSLRSSPTGRGAIDESHRGCADTHTSQFISGVLSAQHHTSWAAPERNSGSCGTVAKPATAPNRNREQSSSLLSAKANQRCKALILLLSRWLQPLDSNNGGLNIYANFIIPLPNTVCYSFSSNL